MGNSIYSDKYYRVSGSELMGLSTSIHRLRDSLRYHAKHMQDSLSCISAYESNMARGVAKFGLATIGANEIIADFDRSLDGIAYKLAHTPIEQEDNNDK